MGEGWSTNSEILFLRDIGKHAAGSSASPRVLLERYIEASRERVWDNGVDGLKCLEFAREKLRVMESGVIVRNRGVGIDVGKREG